ncbi:MAG: hypothetical protein ACFFG0_29940, partial [Candidatus Thorarchaeota archaeon]
INFSIFALSLTIYIFIIKLTHGQTIGKYIVSDIKMKRICKIFFFLMLILIFNYVIFLIYNQKVNLFAIIIWAMIFVILIVFMLIKVILKMLSATTNEEFLIYFIKQARKVKKPFIKEYKKYINKNLPNLTKSINKIEENMIRDKVIYELSNRFLDREKYIQLHKDALNILIEMHENTKSMNKKIFEDIGQFLVPPHTFGIGTDFIRDNIVIPVKSLYKKYPDFNKGFLWYLESYINGILDSELLDTIMLGDIRQLLPEIEDIGYISESLVFDETNDIFYRIAKKITTLEAKIDSNLFFHTKDGIIDDIINTVYKSRVIEVNVNSYYRTTLMNATSISRLRDLCRLDLSLHHKINIINKCIEIVKIISESKNYNYIYGFFSSFQDMWESLVKEKHILENREQQLKIPGLHPFTIIPYIRDIVTKFVELTNKNTIFVIESKQYALSNYFPFMKQINRIIINLAFELFNIFQSTKNEEIKNIALNTLQYTYDKSIDLGEKLESIENFDIVNYIACPIIIGHFLVTCGVVEGNKDGLKYLKNKTDSEFGIKCIFGIKIIVHLYKKENDNYILENEMYNDLVKNYMDDIKSVFFRSELDYEKYEKGEIRFPCSPLDYIHDFLDSIEWRYGKTERKGIMMSKHINQIILMLSDIQYQQERNSFFHSIIN